MKRQHMWLGIAVITAVTTLAGHASAANIAWWRMGDSDSAPADGTVTGNDIGGGVFHGAGSGIVDEYSGDNDLFRGADTLDYQYSTDVPAPMIYDPISDTTLSNGWSANSASAGARPQANGVTPAPPAQTIETFVKFTALTDGNSGNDFLYALSNSSGGFRMESFADGSLRLRIKEEDGPGDGPYTEFTTPAGVVQAGVWHHIGLVMAPDTTGNDDIFIYVDGLIAGSGNYTNDDSMPASGFPLLVGHVFGTDGSGAIPIHYDETRYFSHALSPSEFLQAVPEPTSLGIVLMGAVGFLARRRA